MTDVIVVGSGPGGTNAAARLVEAGRSILMLDFGNRDSHYANLVPSRSFLQLRHHDPEQHRYLLGDEFEGIPFGTVRVGAQLTPPRSYALADATERMPVDAPGFAVSMSLARGGLGVASGAPGCSRSPTTSCAAWVSTWRRCSRTMTRSRTMRMPERRTTCCASIRRRRR